MKTPLITRLTDRLFGGPIIQNNFRGELVEEMVAMALAPEWELCGGDWASCDLIRSHDGLRIQVKQSAARQSWHRTGGPKPRPTFSIATKAGRWEGDTWIEEVSRNADLFVFGFHPIDNETADHRDPDQWEFYIVAEAKLPGQKSIGLPALRKLTGPVTFAELRANVEAAAVTK